MQWVPIDNIVWSVTQPAGVLLWKRPIHPTFSNPLLSYLAGMYNTWGGNLDYRFKVAGTGFHAGAIAIVRIPPNRTPEEFQSPTAWGAFEYLVIDPKTLETESVGVSDQRPISFHYFPFNAENSYSFGGWIAMYVLIPLNTSATGSQQIAIQAFCKPGDNFQYSQLIMPSNNTIANPFPPQYEYFFDNFHLSDITTAPIPCEHIVIEPDTVKETFFVLNCYSADGQYLSKWLTDPVEKPPEAVEYSSPFPCIVTNEDPGTIHFFRDQASIWVPNNATVGFVTIDPAETNRGGEAFLAVANTTSYSDKIIEWSLHQSFSKLKAKQYVTTEFTPGKLDNAYTDNTFAAAGSDESIVHFANKDRGVKSIQNRRLTELFKSGLLRNMFYANVCALFTVVSKDEELPLGQAKLYREGFFTMKAIKTANILDANNIKFVFSGFVQRTDPIQRSPEHQKNMMLFRALHRNSSRPQ